MSVLSVNNSITLDSIGFGTVANVTGDQSIIRKKDNFPAALAGTITTRTDNDTAVLTFTSDPGLSVGNRVDVYWTVGGVSGVRRGMLVSAVAGSGPYTVTVGTGSGDVGAGDAFPVVSSPITLGKVQSFTFAITGNDLLALVASCTAKGVVVVADGSNAELWAAVFSGQAGSKIYYSGDGTTNPLVGVSAAKVFMSHGDSSTVQAIKVGAMTS